MQKARLPGRAPVEGAIAGCEELAAAHAINNIPVPPDGKDWSCDFIMDECRRKTRNYLPAHVYDYRSASAWPPVNLPFSRLDDESLEKVERRKSREQVG